MTKPFATVLEASTSLGNKTGSWRTKRPEYAQSTSPCNAACPAGENVRLWLTLAKAGKFYEAWKIITKDNPFPATMGRVCYHNCEKVCNRESFDEAVNISAIERSIGDMAIAQAWSFENVTTNSGKKVLVIGGGPSGLAAAYFLKMLGHNVAVYESHLKAGGMMRYGVPRYRLSRRVIDAEIRRIENVGVKVICQKKITDINAEVDDFDAVYLAIGAHKASQTDIEIKNKPNIIDAVDLFKKVEDDFTNFLNIGNKVFVYGGGNTAIDAARTALRLGAQSVKIIYRRTIRQMPAHATEINEALAEGIEILCLRTISSIDGGKVFVNKMNYDEERDVLTLSEETEILHADSVIFAIGQSVDVSILNGVKNIKISEKGVIEIDKNMATGVTGVFAGGDVASRKRTITNAIGHAKKAAVCIDAYLRSTTYPLDVKEEVTHFKKLNVVYFKKSARITALELQNISFEEKNISYSEKKLMTEASRCFSCGSCSHCDNCYGYCPDNAIVKRADGSLEMNYDYCKGCGICATECPCGVIKMVPNDKTF
ncbi:MAG: FAD-dependent oxidoreductase [Holosporaceae bacterium]|jgi:2-oxoacid:acceptor oxidoreductase delta subunit (pyruvate/2-ketoisovalerate family)|nr:FAD-dependent oxidoreductase [Holosporaceae bacterium]